MTLNKLANDLQMLRNQVAGGTTAGVKAKLDAIGATLAAMKWSKNVAKLGNDLLETPRNLSTFQHSEK